MKKWKCFVSFSYYDHYTMIKRKKSFFLLATMITNQEGKICVFIYSLRSLRHDEDRKFFFHLTTTITTLWSREKKVFFSFSYYDQNAMIKRKKSFFPLATMFTMKTEKCFFLFFNYDHYAIIKRKNVFFSISYYDHYAMIKRKKVFFHLPPTITTPWSREKKVFPFSHYLH